VVLSFSKKTTSKKPLVKSFVTKKEDLQILLIWLTIQHAWTQTSASLHWSQLTSLIDFCRVSPFTLWSLTDKDFMHTNSTKNVCRSRSFQLYSLSLQLHKHTNAQYLYRSHLTQDRTTKTKPLSQPLVPELLVILTKWMSRTCLLLQCAFLESYRNPKEHQNQPSRSSHANSLKRLQT
jgi:hypothetical protein